MKRDVRYKAVPSIRYKICLYMVPLMLAHNVILSEAKNLTRQTLRLRLRVTVGMSIYLWRSV